ncbi:MAG: lipase family protein [Clostridia bacterium]|nr:lipase family protein [Clostridia bacterium]
MKKIIALALVLIMTALPAMAMPADMTAMTSIPVEYAFTTPSTEFSMTTAWFMLVNFMGQGKAETAAQMENLGLTVVQQENYGKPMSDHSHTSAYTLATGQLPVRGELRNAAVITIRGTSDGEWYSNFDIASENGNNCTVAENFYAATEAIYAAVKPELEKLEDPVIIATGYSRGAGCSNLLGLMLNEDFNKEDIYIYTYATPTTVRGEVENDENIFNLVNMNDMITSMPPQAWGFTRAGIDIELRDSEFVNTEMHLMFLTMLGVCPDLDSYYNDRHAVDAPGLSEDGVTMYELFIAFADLMSGDQALMASAQELINTLSAAQNDFSAFLPLFYQSMLGNTGENQHMPEVYIRLMMALGM